MFSNNFHIIRIPVPLEGWGFSAFSVPKLMATDEETDSCSPNSDTRDFYDWGMGGQTFQLHSPEARHHFCYAASNNGWLVMASEDMEILYLLNPITREQILLPSVCSTDDYKLAHIRKAIIIGNPSKPGDCYVAAFFFTWLIVVKPDRDNAWTMVATPRLLENIADHQGLLYCISHDFDHVQVWSIEPVQMMMTSTLEMPVSYDLITFCYHSYVFQVNGEFIGVKRPLEDVINVPGKGVVVVVKLLQDEYRWVEVRDLGDCFFFLGEHSSMALSPVPPGSGFRRNSIYFSHHGYFERIDMETYVLIYSLEDKLYQPYLFTNSTSRIVTPTIWVSFNDRRRET